MLFIFLITLFSSSYASQVITIYGDVFKNTEFFTKTFPWIIDNIGGEITVDYFLLGSGRYIVPQMCALHELKKNTFLQAQYLKCEAEGNPSEYCLCETGIDAKKFRQCVASGGALAAVASAKFSKLNLDISLTPIVELGSNKTLYDIDDIYFLSIICKIFDPMPTGCVRPTDVSEGISDRKAIAQFERFCIKEFPVGGEDEQPVATTLA